MAGTSAAACGAAAITSQAGRDIAPGVVAPTNVRLARAAVWKAIRPPGSHPGNTDAKAGETS